MSARGLGFLLALLLVAVPGTAADTSVPGPGPLPAEAPMPPAAAPMPGGATIGVASTGWAALRMGAASAVVAAVMLGSLAVYRRLAGRGPRPAAAGRARARRRPGWFARWMPPPPADGDRVELLARTWVGSKEAVCVVRVGRERFLLGLAGGGLTLLSRLDPDPVTAPGTVVPEGPPAVSAREAVAARRPAVEPGPAAVPEPAASDFATALREASAAEAQAATEVTEEAIRAALARSRERLARQGRATGPAGTRIG